MCLMIIKVVTGLVIMSRSITTLNRDIKFYMRLLMNNINYKRLYISKIYLYSTRVKIYVKTLSVTVYLKNSSGLILLPLNTVAFKNFDNYTFNIINDY